MPEDLVEQPKEISPVHRISNLEKGEMSPAQREIRGVWEAIHLVDQLARNRRIPIDEMVVNNIHRKVMGYFHPDIAGNYRDYNVEIAGAVFLPPHWSQVRRLMLQFGRQLAQRTETHDTSLSSLENTVEIAAWAHYDLARIHPFVDGNGRTSRLLTDLIIKRAGLYYPTDWGSENREYIDALRTSDITEDTKPFEQFLARKLASRCDEVLRSLNKSGMEQLTRKSPKFQEIIDRKNNLLRIAGSEKV